MNATQRPTRAEIEAINDGLKAVGLTGPELGKAMGEIMKRLGPAAAKEERAKVLTDHHGHLPDGVDPITDAAHYIAASFDHLTPWEDNEDGDTVECAAYHERVEELEDILAHVLPYLKESGYLAPTTGKVKPVAWMTEGEHQPIMLASHKEYQCKASEEVADYLNGKYTIPLYTHPPTTGLDVEGVMRLVNEHDLLLFNTNRGRENFRKALEAHAENGSDNLRTYPWISVEDRMPPNNTPVLGLRADTWGDKVHVEGFAIDDGGYWYFTQDGDVPEKTPTHWMPLPSPLDTDKG